MQSKYKDLHRKKDDNLALTVIFELTHDKK